MRETGSINQTKGEKNLIISQIIIEKLVKRSNITKKEGSENLCLNLSSSWAVEVSCPLPKHWQRLASTLAELLISQNP